MKREYLRLHHVCKFIAGITVLNCVDFWLVEGEWVSIVGPSGCGKGSLARVLSGDLKIDSGLYTVCGKRPRRFSLIQAQKAGIYLISRVSGMIEDMTVGENLLLHHSKGLNSVYYIDTIHMLAQQICQQFGVQVDIHRKVSSLKREEHIILEICRAVFLKARVLILNEVFSLLSPLNQCWLLEHLEEWKRKGLSVVSLDVWMNRLTEQSDRIIFMNYGKIALECEPEQYSYIMAKQLMERWMRQEFPLKQVENKSDPPDRIALRIQELVLPGKQYPFSLSIHCGEVVGIIGKPEDCRALAMVISGRVKHINGNIFLGDIVQTAKKLRVNVGFLDENLLREGSFPSLTVLDNFVLYSLMRQRHRHIITGDYEKFLYDHFCKASELNREAWFCTIDNLPKNQGIKVILYRWLACGVRVVVLETPFEYENQVINREIYNFIQEAVKRKIAVLLTGTHIDFMNNICERIWELPE